MSETVITALVEREIAALRSEADRYNALIGVHQRAVDDGTWADATHTQRTIAEYTVRRDEKLHAMRELQSALESRTPSRAPLTDAECDAIMDRVWPAERDRISREYWRAQFRSALQSLRTGGGGDG